MTRTPERHWCVYALREKDSVEYRYIGVTSKTLEQRFKGHIKNARSGADTHKCNWIRKVGYENIEIVLLQVVDEGNLAQIHFAEIFWIHTLRCIGMRLTNATDGGLPDFGFRHSADTIEKIRAASTGRNTGKLHWTFGLSKEDHPSYGKPRPESTRLRQSQSLTGRKLSDSHRESIKRHHADISGANNSFFGKTHSEASRQKMSAAKSGVPLSESTKLKMSKSKTGKPNPSAQKSSHTRWHTNKGISKPDTCNYCKELMNV